MLFAIWLYFAPVLALKVAVSSLTLPFDLWTNIAAGDYPPGARAFWEAANG